MKKIKDNFKSNQKVKRSFENSTDESQFKQYSHT